MDYERDKIGCLERRGQKAVTGIIYQTLRAQTLDEKIHLKKYILLT